MHTYIISSMFGVILRSPDARHHRRRRHHQRTVLSSSSSATISIFLLVLLTIASTNGFSLLSPFTPATTTTRGIRATPIIIRNEKKHSFPFLPMRHSRPSMALREGPSSSQDTTAVDDSEIRTTTTTTTMRMICWSPPLRRILGGIAVAGSLETAYLTVQKVTGHISTLCGVDGNCNAVLMGPYSKIPFTDLPLTGAGFLAYTLVAYLALEPLYRFSTSSTTIPTNEEEDAAFILGNDDDDSENRVALMTLTTTMATFSVGLMILLFGILQTTCPYCIFSAACSVSLAMLAWIGGCLPSSSSSTTTTTTSSSSTATMSDNMDEADEGKPQQGGGGGAISSGFLSAMVGVLLLFISGATEDGAFTSLASFPSENSMVLASNSRNNGETPQSLYAAPSITTESSKRAMDLAATLQSMDAKMYGAYWCSHCLDQKETLGKQAFSKITYVECSKDGVNSETKLCKTKQVPGYPTWEIQGQLYPGQQELEELEELVKSISSTVGDDVPSSL